MADIESKLLTASDISRFSRELVAAEARSRQIWIDLSSAQKAGVVCFIREQLIRLLEDPDWLPGSIRSRDGDRLDVTISFDLSDAQSAWAREFASREQDLYENLVTLAERYGLSEDDL